MFYLKTKTWEVWFLIKPTHSKTLKNFISKQNVSISKENLCKQNFFGFTDKYFWFENKNIRFDFDYETKYIASN